MELEQELQLEKKEKEQQVQKRVLEKMLFNSQARLV